MKTKYSIGDVVYIKAVVERANIYTDNKGTVVTEYRVRIPEAIGRDDWMYVKEEYMYTRGEGNEKTRMEICKC